MRLSTRGRYATRAMVDLALHFGEGTVLLRDVSERQGVSEQYLKQLLTPLRAAGLIRTVLGSRGGFALVRPPSEIRLIEIINATEGSNAPVDCVDTPGICPRVDECATRDVWVDVKDAVDRVLESVTLQELAERQIRRQAAARASRGTSATEEPVTETVERLDDCRWPLGPGQ